MCMVTIFFAITKNSIAVFKIYFQSLVFSNQNAVVLRFEITSDKKKQFSDAIVHDVLKWSNIQ